MLRVTLRGLAGRRLRAALTALAIVLGVAMISGAYTLTDTMRHSADSLSAASYDGTAAVVDARTAVKITSNDSVQKPTIPASLLAQVRSVPQVATAVGDVNDTARLIDAHGKTIGSGPYFGVGLDAARAGGTGLTPFRLTAGHYATAPGQVAIDAATAKNNHLGVGSTVRIVTRGPVRSFQVAGIVTFGDVKSIGKASVAVFDLPTAQALFDKQGAYDDILISAKPGVSPPALRKAVAASLPPSAQVQTAAAQDRFDLKGLKQFISIIQYILIGFGGVAIFVGAFTIFNTLSITVAQRSREFALLRTIGASRRQVLRSVVLEALVVGLIASLVGLAAGLGLAKGLNSLFSSLGLDLPSAGLVFAGRTVIVALLVGVLVTLAAGLAPALRATRVSPVTVLREGSHIPPSKIGRRAPQIAAVTSLLGVGLLAYGMFVHGVSTGGRIALLIVGCMVLFLGVALLSPRLVVPLASALGRPAQRLAGPAGTLARRNSMRNPGRTAATASALMIGVALVAFVSVLGAGINSSTKGALAKEVRAQYVVTSSDNFSPIDPATVRAAAGTPGVTAATGVLQDVGKAYGKKISVDGLDTSRIGQVLHFDWKQGDDRALAELTTGGAIVSDSFATKHHLAPGDRLTVLTPRGAQLRLRVAGVDKPPSFNPLGLGEVRVSSTTFARYFDTPRPRFALIAGNGATLRELRTRLAAFPDAKVETAATFEHDQTSWVNTMTTIFDVLLALAVIVSLFGIVNTLVLSVFERTRELGMLRAVGMTRRQVRRMIRQESVITALIGAALGIVVGLFLAALVTAALSKDGLSFAVPVGSLVVFVIVAALAGVLAAILPARRAARLDVLGALQYE